MALSLRQGVFAARSELAAGITGANDAAQNAAMAQMAVTVEAKFAQLDGLTASLSNGLEALGLREQRVEAVVEHQVAGQPKQEEILNGAFQQMDAKISHVAALARKFDGTEVNLAGNNVIPFTLAMSQDMQKLRTQFEQLPAAITNEVLNAQHPDHRATREVPHTG